MKRNLSRYVNDKYPSNPQSFSEIADAFKDVNIFNEYGLNLRKTERFYIDTVVEPMYSFTLLGSSEVIKMIEHIPAEERRYLLDGTFSIRPVGPYYQVLVMYIEFRNDVVPFMYVVMSNKRADAYEAIFNYIENKIFAMKPTSFMADFEGGIRAAIRNCYPAAKLHGCWYHYSAAVRGKMTSYGMRRFINENQDAMGIYLQLLRLPLLPDDFIVAGYHLIEKEARDKGLYSKFKKLFTYFNHFWLSMVSQFIIPISILNQGPMTSTL